jgi:hypothetical protein
VRGQTGFRSGLRQEPESGAALRSLQRWALLRGG